MTEETLKLIEHIGKTLESVDPQLAVPIYTMLASIKSGSYRELLDVLMSFNEKQITILTKLTASERSKQLNSEVDAIFKQQLRTPDAKKGLFKLASLKVQSIWKSICNLTIQLAIFIKTLKRKNNANTNSY
ncbi:hypothetical protein KAR91_64265 [Candidatus Pacearchaeota archaeon]|nr:hypothetical protein [Candidatus Pacearchaeota archaeon]